MLERFFRFLKELYRRVKVTIAGIGVQGWSQRFSMQYNQLYAGALGADAVQLGFLSSVGAAASSIVSVPQGWAAEKYGVKNVMLLGLACAFLSATVYALAGNWWILIPAVSLISISRLNPLPDIIFITVTNPQQRATVVSLSRVIWGILNIFAPIAAAVIVTQFGGINAQGIRPLYYIQLVLAIFVFFFIAVKLQALPRHGRRKDESGSIVQDFRELFKGER